MAAKFDAETLKKHHFWFLLAFVVIGLILAWIGLFFDVPEATVATKEEQEKKQKDLKNLQAKPRSLIAKYSEQVKELEARRVNMWRQAWNEQKDLYFWPAKRPKNDNNPFNVLEPQRAFFLDRESNGFSEKQLAVVANRKFGEEFKNTEGVRDQFRNPEIYEATYRKIVADLAPMQFRDDAWQSILRYVPSWGQMPTSEEVWLAMEDLWVQREILMRIHQVNLDAAKFASTSDLAGALGGMAAGLQVEKPNSRVYRSRVWQLDLQLVDDGNKRVLKGTVKNLTNRLQVFGVGNVLRLKVWTADPNNNSYFPFEIEGVSVPSGNVLGKNPLPIKPIAAHEIPADWPARGIFKVEQIFDARTVPVKRIEYLDIGKLSDRNNNLPMRMAAFSEAAAARDPSAASTGPVGDPGRTEGPGMPGAEQAPAVALNGLTPQHKLNRVRYIDVTGQLRRLPIGIVVVTDQTYMKDIIESIANTKMRFQTTQVEWSRFHNILSYRGGSTESSPFGPGPGTREREGSPDSGPGPMFGSGFPLGPGSGYPGYPGFGLGSGGPENSSQDQFSANLMELSVYGLISLYEKFDDGKGGTPKQPSQPVADKNPPITKDKDTEPVQPMPKDKTPPVKEKGKEPVLPMPKEKLPTPMDNKDPKNPNPKAKAKDATPSVNPK
jgi:hypothetical protein